MFRYYFGTAGNELMKTDSEIDRFRKYFLLNKLILVLTFIVGIVTAVLTAITFFALSSGPLTAAITTAHVPNQTLASTAQIQMPGPLVTFQTAYQYYGYTALISWVGFAGALIWRGHIRSVWSRSHFSYDTFRLIISMRGAQTRLKLLHNLSGPRNKLQLATALGIDWKAVDKHVQMLEKNGLIQRTDTSGTTIFYEVTDKGRRLLDVLEELGVDNGQG
jgi:predicted transcriptional regulator